MLTWKPTPTTSDPTASNRLVDKIAQPPTQGTAMLDSSILRLPVLGFDVKTTKYPIRPFYFYCRRAILWAYTPNGNMSLVSVLQLQVIPFVFSTSKVLQIGLGDLSAPTVPVNLS
ncbi:hypothetical protein J6590_005302 [Homalodisca vitripennis]|nr:hypothetical protein J6590_005302 [Homalodisca vitripennis]